MKRPEGRGIDVQVREACNSSCKGGNNSHGVRGDPLPVVGLTRILGQVYTKYNLCTCVLCKSGARSTRRCITIPALSWRQHAIGSLLLLAAPGIGRLSFARCPLPLVLRRTPPAVLFAALHIPRLPPPLQLLKGPNYCFCLPPCVLSRKFSQQWYVKLALKLLWERQLGSASAVEGYVNVLPAQGSFETLIHWTDQVGQSISRRAGAC